LFIHFFMNADGHAYKLCGSVNPSVRQPGLYSATWQDIQFELRLVYIADDDLGFINRCTHYNDEYSSNLHREPYHSVAESDTGQTFIISIEKEPVCVGEVHHAKQHYTGEEFMPKEGDYMLKLFFADNIGMTMRSAVLHFFAEYCGGFTEVGNLAIKAENLDETALIDAGFTPYADATGRVTGIYFYSTSNENV
jgi:hypothetical protein